MELRGTKVVDQRARLFGGVSRSLLPYEFSTILALGVVKNGGDKTSATASNFCKPLSTVCLGVNYCEIIGGDFGPRASCLTSRV